MEQIPYIAYESGMARMERTNRRIWIVCIILIIALVGSNLAWLFYERQFDTISTEITQENADGINNYIGNDGDINNGKTDG